MYWLTLLIGLGLLWPISSFAADGDSCDGNQSGRINRGTVEHAWCVVLCDAATTATTTCTEFDLGDIGQTDIIVFEMFETGNEDCTAAVATINTSGESGITAADTNAFDIGSTTALSLVGTRRIVLDARAAPLDRYIYTTVSGETCTTGTFDVIMYGLEIDRL